MKTIVLICTPLGLENSIPEIKRLIVEYAGVRLVKENPAEAPLIELSCILDGVDKLQISELVKNALDTAAVFLIEAEDDKFGHNGGNMCVLQPVK